MSATRRELFKTSVLSAVGVASIGLLSGCETWVHGLGGSANVPVVGMDTTSQWYVFLTANGVTAVYTAGLPPPNLTPSTCPFDTPTYVQQLRTAGQLLLAISKNFTIGIYPFATDGSGNLMPTGNFTPNAVSWNEIGRA